MFRLLTPGGGGYGTPDDSNSDINQIQEPPNKRQRCIEHGSVYDFTRLQESS